MASGIVGLKPKQRRAAVVLANGGRNVDAAGAAKVTERTVERWRGESDFMAVVDALSAEIAAAVMTTGIASKRERLKAYNERWAVLREHVEEDDGVNTYVARELRELEKQAAIEVGQWEEKHEVSIVPTVREYPSGWGSPAPAVEGAE